MIDDRQNITIIEYKKIEDVCGRNARTSPVFFILWAMASDSI